MNTFVFIK